MKYVYIGKIVNTHALKGEVRLISNFEFKEKVFVKNSVLYVGNEKEKLKIESTRKHKKFDMVKFYSIDTIGDALKYKGCNAYFNEEDLKLEENEILISDLVNYEVYNNNNFVGKITEYRSDNGNNMVRVNEKYIPYNSNFIDKYDKINKRIYFHDIGAFL